MYCKHFTPSSCLQVHVLYKVKSSSSVGPVLLLVLNLTWSVFWFVSQDVAVPLVSLSILLKRDA